MPMRRDALLLVHVGGNGMKMRVLAILLAAGLPAAASAQTGDVDEIIRNLDLTSFPNSVGARRIPGKTTFSDYGFAVAEKTAGGARLVRRDDGRSKSFTILTNGPDYMRLCFHDKFVVMPESASPLRYHTTLALVVSKSRNGPWTARPFRGGFVNCRNDPSAPYDGVSPQG